MEKHENKSRGKPKTRLHLQLAQAVAACLLAAIIAAPLLLFGHAQPEPSPNPNTAPTAQTQVEQPTNNTTSDNTGKSPAFDATGATEAAAPSYEPPADPQSSPPIISHGEDGIAAEHEGGVVLVKVPEGTKLDELNEQLTDVEALESASVTSSDLTLGWAELPLADGATVPDAISQLEACGAVESAQPNYVYRLVGGASADPDIDSAGGNVDIVDGTLIEQPDSSSGDDPPPSGTGKQVDTRDYYKFVNDYRSKDEMVIITVWLRAAYEYLHAKGYVTEAGYDPNRVNQLTPETTLTWTRDESWRRPTVAILDTGCQLDHVDLAANIVDHYDAVYPGDWRGDIDGHGTHVAGITAATTNNGIGITGVSLNAGLLPVNVFDKKTPNSSPLADSKDIARGYEYVMQHASEYNIRVINMSLGSDTEDIDNDDRALLEAIDNAYRANILTIIASGNDADTRQGAYCDYPTDFAVNAVSVIDCAVSHVVADDNSPFAAILTLSRDSYSNYNMEGTVAKPVSALGSYVMSTIPYSAGELDSKGLRCDQVGKYENKNGTSMASPCVAGIAALVLQVNPSLTPEQIKSVLYSTADDVTEGPPGQTNFTDDVAPGFDLYTGFGTVNAYRAVVAADTDMYLSVDTDRGETATPVLAKGVEGARSVAFSAPEGSSWTWASSSPSVATVDASGLVTAAGPGQAIISASDGTNTLYATVTVYEPKLSGPNSVAYNSSATLSMDAPPGRGTWKWTSSDTNVATVNSWSGAVTGKAVGKSTTITATLLANPDIKLTKSVSVTRADLSAAKVELAQTRYTYGGKACTPAVKSVTLNGIKLAEGRDYTVSYANNNAAGTATARVTGTGNYTGSASATFTIFPADTSSKPSSSSTQQSSKSSSAKSSSAATGGSGSGSATPSKGSSPTPQVMFRLYNPNSGEHFYTSDATERDVLVDAGWNLEGEGWRAPAMSNTPVFRMYNPVAGEHHYTPNAAERDMLLEAGWNDEGIGWYSDDAQTVPLYRDYNPNEFANNHNYTADWSEHAMLMDVGWRDEGIAWYGM